MSSRATETLDELIDRVAAELTQAPVDTGFGRRLVADLDQSPTWLPSWTTAAAVVALIVAAVGLPWIAREEPPLVVRTAGEPGSEHAAALPPNVAAIDLDAASRTAGAPAATDRRPTRRARSEPLLTTIPALAAPPALVFEGLGVDALDVPAVEIAELDVSILAIDALTTDLDSKEPQQ